MLEKKYDAFISYSHEDANFASLLERVLEDYRPPKISNISQNHLEIFRDKKDFVGVEYDKAVKQHLQDSRKLIVICTPRARVSQYVNDEISFFAETNGSEQIIPILLDGLPNNEAILEQETIKAFPEALINCLQMPLAIDYRGFRISSDKVDKGEFDDAWFTLLANIYDVPRSAIEQREKERQIRTRNQWIKGLSSVIVILFVISGFAILNWFKADQATERATEQRNRAQHALAVAEVREAHRHYENKNYSYALAHLANALRFDQTWMISRTLLLNQLLQKEWYLNDQIFKHDEPVFSAKFLSDEARIVTLSAVQENLIESYVWDVRTGNQLGDKRNFGDLKSIARFSEFSFDGALVVTVSKDGYVSVWENETGKQLWSERKHETGVSFAVFSVGGLLLTASEDGVLCVSDAITGKKLWSEKKHKAPISSANFSSDDARLVTASMDNTARIWDTETGKQIGVKMIHGDEVMSAVFSSDHTRVVTASRDKIARLWDTKTGKQVGNDMVHEAEVISAMFSSDNMRIVTSSLNTVQIWDVNTSMRIGQVMNHEESVLLAKFSSDGMRVVTSTIDNTVRMWDTKTGKQLGDGMMHGYTTPSATFSSDDTRLLTASMDKTARIWNIKTGKIGSTELGIKGEKGLVAFSADGTAVLKTSMDKTASVWSAKTGSAMANLIHEDTITSASLSADGALVVTTSKDNTARIWETRTGMLIGEPLRHEGVVSAEFNMDGTQVITLARHDTPSLLGLFDSSFYSVRIWDVRTSRTLGAEIKPDGNIISAIFSSDSAQIITIADVASPFSLFSRAYEIKIWDIQASAIVGEIISHNKHFDSNLFDKSRTRLVTVSNDNTVQVWNLKTGTMLNSVVKHDDDKVIFVTLNRDGTRVLISTKYSDLDLFTTTTESRLWDVDTGKMIGEPMKHEGKVVAGSFSADDMYLVTATDNGSLRIWDAKTGKALSETFSYENTKVDSVIFSVNGTQLLTVLEDKIVRVWDVLPVKSDPNNLLSELVDAVIGIKLDENGAFINLNDQAEVLHRLRQRTANAPLGESTAESFVRWFLSDPWERSISPLSKKTVPEYIQQEIAAGRYEFVAQEFPGHPLIWQNKSEKVLIQ